MWSASKYICMTSSSGSRRFLKRGSWNIRKRRVVVFVWTNKNGGFGIQLRHTSYSARMHHFNLIRLNGEKSIWIRYVWIRPYFKREQNISVFHKITPGYAWTRPKLIVHCPVFFYFVVVFFKLKNLVCVKICSLTRNSVNSAKRPKHSDGTDST